tara:strand:- start:895 stop:1302 length:408 start_codon:yes stop_codon:yes gene_type:complete
MNKAVKIVLITLGSLGLGAIVFKILKDRNIIGNKGQDNPVSGGAGGGGKLAQVKGTYTNVREAPVVDAGWWDNLVVKVEGANKLIGSVVKTTKGEDGYTWYYLLLSPELKDNSSMWGSAGEHTHGWAREDVINII